MLKGNVAKCNGAYSFSWDSVDQIQQHDGQTCTWRETSNNLLEVTLGPEVQSVSIDGRAVHCTCRVDNFHKKAKQLIALIPHFFTDASCIRQFERPDDVNEPSDSGSEEDVIEPSYAAAFDDVTWKIILQDFEHLRLAFTQARDAHFDNAIGKVFVHRFIAFLCWIDRDQSKYCNVGTCTSGEEQPGCCNVGYFNLRYVSDRSRSQTPVSTASSSEPTPLSEDNNYKVETHNRYSDVSFWDFLRRLYRVVVEVKSSDNQPAVHQSTEQMVGLYRAHQRYMLGFVVKPNVMAVKVLEKSSKGFNMHVLPDMSLVDEDMLVTLGKVVIAFIFLVQC